MAVVIRCYPNQLLNDGTVIVRGARRVEAELQEGKRAFIWTIENSGGHGLTQRGIIKSVLIENGNIRLQLEVENKSPHTPFRNEDLNRIRRLNQPGNELDVANKLHKYVHANLTALTDGEEAYLNSKYGTYLVEQLFQAPWFYCMLSG